MATVAVGQGASAVARTSSDRALLRGFLEQDRLFSAYAICDLDDREFGRTRCGIATAGDEVVAVGVEYTGPAPQPLFLLGRNDGIAAILRDVIRPRAAYVAVASQNLEAVGQAYRLDPGPPMIRMHVDRATFRPWPAAVERLLPVEVGELNRLYQLGFAAWLPASAVAEGVYFGIRAGGRLVAAAGTHVVSREGAIGVVGNVMTHGDYRNRGFAKAVTSAVTADLLRWCDDVVLNVRSDNPPAIAAYRGLGYAEHCRFEERLGRRTAPTWPDLAGSIRRLFAPRPAFDPAIPFVQAHPVAPAAEPGAAEATSDAREPAPAIEPAIEPAAAIEPAPEESR
jgi:ribosomal protein S18 acetylase RimI-like enzyme